MVSAVAPVYPGMQQAMMMGSMMGAMSSASSAPGEGWVKLRGVPFTASKQDFIQFFQVRQSVGPFHRMYV